MNTTDLALGLLFAGDLSLMGIVALSLAVSLSASVAAAVIGLPLGAALAMFEFRGRAFLILVASWAPSLVV